MQDLETWKNTDWEDVAIECYTRAYDQYRLERLGLEIKYDLLCSDMVTSLCAFFGAKAVQKQTQNIHSLYAKLSNISQRLKFIHTPLDPDNCQARAYHHDPY